MKKFLIALLALAMVLPMLLVGCSPDNTLPPDNPNNPNTTPGSTGYTVTSTYLPADFSAQMKTYFEGNDKSFAAHTTTHIKSAPYVMVDGTLTECTLKSITIPVQYTTDAKFGKFTFTLSVVNMDITGMKSTLADPIRTYEIDIDAREYDLEDRTTIRKFIKVPLSPYKITLGKNETLAFGAPTDNIHAAMVKTPAVNGENEKYPAAKYMIDNWGVVCHYYRDAEEDGKFKVSQDSLLFDFELEHTYDSEAAYNELVTAQNNAEAAYQSKLAAVKAAYQGKYISMMGDSISTHGTVTNQNSYNPTLSINAVYGPHNINGNSYHYSKVY